MRPRISSLQNLFSPPSNPFLFLVRFSSNCRMSSRSSWLSLAQEVVLLVHAKPYRQKSEQLLDSLVPLETRGSSLPPPWLHRDEAAFI